MSPTFGRANELGLAWCDEVNAVVHSEICAIPAERLVKELELMGTLPQLRASIGKLVVRKVDRLSCVRFGSARYSVPTIHIGRQVELVAQDAKILVIFLGEIVAEHDLVAPGETSILDEHYGGPRPMPTRAVRPKTSAEKAFCALGPAAESFIKGAAAHGITSLKGDLDELAQMEAAHGKVVLLAALERAASFGRFRAHDVRSIIAAGTGAPRPAAPGEALIVELPLVPHALAERLRHRRAVVSTAPPALPADIEAGLRRLRLRAMRSLSPELLVTAKTQRWKPEEFLRTLVEAEIASRDASNAANRLQAAAFPVTKTLDEFDVRASSVKQTTVRLPLQPRVGAGHREPLPRRPGRHRQEPPARRPRACGHRVRIPGPLFQCGRVGRDPLSGPGRQLGRPCPRGDPQS